MSDVQQDRFVTFLQFESEDVMCLTNQEFLDLKAASDPSVEGDRWEEWVWQYAETKQQAIAQHFIKMDIWHQNPGRMTY